MIFSIVITETLTRIINIEAATQDEALDRARSLYREEEIVLDSSDFVDVSIGFNTNDCQQSNPS